MDEGVLVEESTGGDVDDVSVGDGVLVGVIVEV